MTHHYDELPMTYGSHLDRLIICRDHVVENKFANLEFKEFEAEEEQRKHPGSALANLLTREARWFARWVNEQEKKGWPESELTWGNCLHETGVLLETTKVEKAAATMEGALREAEGTPALGWFTNGSAMFVLPVDDHDSFPISVPDEVVRKKLDEHQGLDDRAHRAEDLEDKVAEFESHTDPDRRTHVDARYLAWAVGEYDTVDVFFGKQVDEEGCHSLVCKSHGRMVGVIMPVCPHLPHRSGQRQ
jgi:hypothetical protein